MLKRIIIFLVCIGTGALLPAQTIGSPYKFSLAIDVPVGSNAVALLGASYLIGTSHTLPRKETIENLDRKTVCKFDRDATYRHSKTAAAMSDATLYAACALPLLQLINKNSRKDFGKVAAISAEAFAINLGITNLVKETVKRKRPLMYNPDVSLNEKYKKDNFNSYFSGHVSTVAAMSFGFAKMYADYNPHSKLKPMVWSLCAVFPIVTGVLRHEAGKHFWTDVITGYAAGALVGWAVPYLHGSNLKINNQ